MEMVKRAESAVLVRKKIWRRDDENISFILAGRLKSEWHGLSRDSKL